MAADVKEFINPKSMLTPGPVAAMVATASGALFIGFGLRLPISLLILSFLFCCVVFYSNEFQDANMSRGAKVFFYVLNSIIIFAMATGTHAVLDRTDKAGVPPGSHSSRSFFMGSVYAAELETPKEVVKQKRPLFYNWTKSGELVIKAGPTGSAQAVQYDVEKKNYGAFKEALVGLWFIVPDYKVRVKIDPSEIEGEVSAVTYKLPKGYFDKSEYVVKDKTTNFKLDIEAWKSFVLGAEIELDTGKKILLRAPISFKKGTIK